MATKETTGAQTAGNAVEQAKSAAQKAKETLLAKAAENGGDAAKVEQLASVAPATKTTKVRAEGEKSAKAKESLGVPLDHVITWLHFHCTEEDSEMLKKAAKQRDTKVANMLVKILQDTLEGEKMQELRDDAAKWEDTHPINGRAGKSLESMTAEQLEAEQKKLEARIAKMNEMLAKAKAKIA